jgi:UDP-3-O-[3-hydroxymyristoyl] glucosamine N-acyltransferase
VTIDELAALVSGARFGPDRAFAGVAPLAEAGPEQLAYADAAVPGDCTAGVLLSRAPVAGRSGVSVADPRAAFVVLLGHLFPERHLPGVHPGASVDPSAQLGEGVVVYPGVWIGAGCVVGDETVLFPNVSVYPGTIIGRRCRIHAGAVLGADGFSYHPTAAGLLKVPQVGRLVIGDDVEIGANSTVDRGALGDTRLGDAVKLDNLVHIGHNCTIGPATVAAAQVGIAGSSRIGAACQLGGQVGIADHTEIGDRAMLGARSAAHGRLAGDAAYLGVPAAPIREARRAMMVARKLPEVWQTLRQLQRGVRELRERLDSYQQIRRQAPSVEG